MRGHLISLKPIHVLVFNFSVSQNTFGCYDGNTKSEPGNKMPLRLKLVSFISHNISSLSLLMYGQNYGNFQNIGIKSISCYNLLRNLYGNIGIHSMEW